MNLCAQVTAAMIKNEIVVAVLTSFTGVLIVAIARHLIEMERGHRTPAQAAAEESDATTVALPPSPPSEADTPPADSDNSDGREESSDSAKERSGEESGEEESGDEESGTEESGEEESGEEEENEDTGETADSESSLNKARTDSSYENIQTPQLSGIKQDPAASPIPTIADV
jgi:hypothetical protein